MNLCVNAIATSSQLDALDGTQGVTAMDTNVTSSNKQQADLFGTEAPVHRAAAIGDGAASAASFRILKVLFTLALTILSLTFHV